MKRLIFISEMHQIPKLMPLRTEGDAVVSLKQEVSGELLRRKIKHTSLDDYPKPSEEDALRWMKSWPKRKINGKTFIESVLHDGLSVWWLMESWIYSSSVYFDSFRDVMLAIQTAENVISRERPDEILFADDGKLFSGVLKLFPECNPTVVPMKLFRFLYNAKRSARVAAIRLFINLGFAARRFLWAITSPFHRGASGRILLVSTYAWGRAIGSKGTYVQYDPFIDPLAEELNESAITVNIPTGRLLGLRQLIRNAGKPGYKVLESYYSRDAKKKCRSSVTALRKTWDMLERDSRFAGSFKYRSRNMWALIRRQLSAYFSCRLEGHIRDAELVKSVLESENPKVVVYPGETSEFGRTLFHVASSKGIPSVGIQHGAFSNYILCVHEKGESRTGVASPGNCPIPTKTLVYGPKYRRMLYNWNYPAGSVVVTGAQRFDRIVKNRDSFNKSRFCSSAGIDEKKKIIAFVTSPVPEGDTEVMTSAVAEAAAKTGAQLVVKLHPSESPDFYDKIIRAANGRATILRDVDLYEVLNACDIVVTHLSTAALEAMIFDKPVIMLNLTGKPDRVDYAKKGAAFGVYKKGALLPVVRRLLRKGYYEKRRALVRSYIHENAYITDGNASSRMAKEIRSFCANRFQRS